MKVERTAATEFSLEFESEEELREEHRTNLSFNALRLPAQDRIAVDSKLLVMLRGPWGGEAYVGATVIAMLPDGVALMIDGNPDETLRRLLSRATTAEPPKEEEAEEAEREDSAEKRKSDWDRIRGLSQMDKILLAVK